MSLRASFLIAFAGLAAIGCSDESSKTSTSPPDPCKRQAVAYCILPDGTCGEWYGADGVERARNACTTLKGGFGEGKCFEYTSCCVWPDTASCSKGTPACSSEATFCKR